MEEESNFEDLDKKQADSKTHVATNSRRFQGQTKLERVFDALKKLEKENDIAYFAKIISEKARVNFSTARGALRNLRDKERVFQQYPRGPYSSTPFNVPRMGVAEHIGAYGVCTPRVQQLVLVAEGLCVPKGFPSVEYSLMGVDVRIVFGWKRQKVTGFISCDDGLSLRGLCFVIADFKRRVREVIGNVPEFLVDATRYEFLWDYLGVKIEGVKCVTLTAFMGLVEKFYNKSYGMRHEVKGSVPVSVATLKALMQGGISTANLQQFNYMLVKDSKAVLEELSRWGQETRFLLPTLKSLYEATLRLVERQDAFEKMGGCQEVYDPTKPKILGP